MNFTYTPPTEPGDYWTKDKFGTMRTRHVWRNEFGVLVSHYCGKEWWRPVDRMGFQILWGPRVEPPQPVPWDVMDAMRCFRESGFESDSNFDMRLKLLCDYIAPPKEPDIIGGFPYADPNCKGCGKPLLVENAWITDGCPCNSELGINSMNETRWRLLMQLHREQSLKLAKQGLRHDR